ncbi:MAG: helix-turn-helix transcriptional regulator [Reyranella sp.]|nr:helix-turn-helix transcriptional regulator [Reyranella sp.]MDP3161037.1 helix-turn-helix transcriptional regulator [Reyranella sp.]
MTSAKISVDKRRRSYVRLVGDIHHALNQALTEEHAKRGLTKSRISKLLNVGRSAITKQLSGSNNMTLETLADLAHALDREVKVSLPERMVVQQSNQVSEPVRKAIVSETEARRPLNFVKAFPATATSN